MYSHVTGNFNEPHYVSYIRSDLGGIAEEAGLTPGGKWVSSFTKTLSFTKPLDDAPAGAAAPRGGAPA